MDIRLIEAVIPELASELAGKTLGLVFRLSRFEYVFDLLPSSPIYLFVSIEPARPAIFLSRQRFRELDKTAKPPDPFQLAVKDLLTGAKITGLSAMTNERVVLIETLPKNNGDKASLIVQLTGRSANLFLCNASGIIISAARGSEHEGQRTGDIYAVPLRSSTGNETGTHLGNEIDIPSNGHQFPVSSFLDEKHKEETKERLFSALASAARTRLKREMAKERKLLANLNADRQNLGEPDKWKRFGDLLLASAANNKRTETGFEVADLFDAEMPIITIPAKEKETATEAAERYFKLYTKARNGMRSIEERADIVSQKIAELEERIAELEQAIEQRDETRLREFAGVIHEPLPKRSKKDIPADPHARSFISSDGFEILVGKKAADNDKLTFRIARSLDTWMHAADYPGSHVVIRNPNRKEIPQRTLNEAAQLAAFYSKGSKQTKAAVHYTQKKFVNKPKGSAPGLVSLSSFKTLFVEPVFPNVEKKA